MSRTRSTGALAMAAVLTLLPVRLPAQPAAVTATAAGDHIVGSWHSQRDRERLTFSRNGELWSCFDANVRDKVSRGYWKELQPGRFELHFTHVGLSDCSFVGARERRVQVDIASIAAIRGGRLEVFNSGEGPPDTYLRARPAR